MARILITWVEKPHPSTTICFLADCLLLHLQIYGSVTWGEHLGLERKSHIVVCHDFLQLRHKKSMRPTILFPRVKWAVDSRVATTWEQQLATGRTAGFVEDKSQAISKILRYAEQPLWTFLVGIAYHTWAELDFHLLVATGNESARIISLGITKEWDHETLACPTHSQQSWCPSNTKVKA